MSPRFLQCVKCRSSVTPARPGSGPGMTGRGDNYGRRGRLGTALGAVPKRPLQERMSFRAKTRNRNRTWRWLSRMLVGRYLKDILHALNDSCPTLHRSCGTGLSSYHLEPLPSIRRPVDGLQQKARSFLKSFAAHLRYIPAAGDRGNNASRPSAVILVRALYRLTEQLACTPLHWRGH